MKPIRIACANQCTTCYDCFTRLFEVTELSGEGKNIGKCFCRGEVIVNDCAPAKAVERMVKNINVLCPNFKNGCDWNCGKIGVDHKTLKQNICTSAGNENFNYFHLNFMIIRKLII